MKNRHGYASIVLEEKIKQIFYRLGYTEEQYTRITKYISPLILLENFQIIHDCLIKNFSHDQIIRIGSRSGGYNNLKAIQQNIEKLLDMRIRIQSIVNMSSKNGGSINIQAFINNFKELKKLGFNEEQIIQIVSHCGGAKNIMAVKYNFRLLQELEYTHEEIVNLVASNGGSKYIYAIIAKHKESYELDQKSVSSYDSLGLTFNEDELNELLSFNNNEIDLKHTTLLFNPTPTKNDSITENLELTNPVAKQVKLSI